MRALLTAALILTAHPRCTCGPAPPCMPLLKTALFNASLLLLPAPARPTSSLSPFCAVLLLLQVVISFQCPFFLALVPQASAA